MKSNSEMGAENAKGIFDFVGDYRNPIGHVGKPIFPVAESNRNGFNLDRLSLLAEG